MILYMILGLLGVITLLAMAACGLLLWAVTRPTPLETELREALKRACIILDGEYPPDDIRHPSQWMPKRFREVW